MSQEGKIFPPWSQEQVYWLNQYQSSGVFHPFTCGNDSRHRELVAGPDGWLCIDCGFVQNWAHSFMADKKAILTMKKMAKNLNKTKEGK